MTNQEIVLFGDVQVTDLAPAGPRPSRMDRMATWAEAFDLWLESRRAQNTRRAYRTAWENLLAYSNLSPWEIGKAQVADWVGAMRKAKLSDATIQQRIAAISSFYSYVCDEFTVISPEGREVPLYDNNPAAARSIRPKVSPYDKAVYMSSDEARAFLRAIRQDTPQGLRDFALMLMYLATGRRNSEIRMLTWGAFEKTGGRVWYRWSGKGKSRRNECPLRAWEAIQYYLKAVGRLDTMQDDSYIFTALTDRATRLRGVTGDWDPHAQPLSMRFVGDLVKKYARRAGLDPRKIHVHTLRHTAAMLRKEAGDDVEAISSFLEHSSLAITQIYVHRVEGKKDTNWSKVEALLGL